MKNKVVVWVISLGVMLSMVVLPAAGAITIVTWDDQTGESEAKAQAWTAVQEQFAVEHPDIKVGRMPIPAGEDIRRAFVAAMTGGTGPDAFQDSYPVSIPVWVEAGFCAPIEDYVNAWEYKDDIVDALWDSAQIGSHLYGVPNETYVMTLLYNKDIFAEVGLPARAPENWDELVEFAVRATDWSIPRWGFGIMGLSWLSWYWENFVWQAGGEVTTLLPNGEVELSFTDGPGVTAAQFYQDLRLKHNCTQKDILAGYGDLKGDFRTRRSAMWMSSNGSIGGFIEEGMTVDEVGVGMLPAGPTGVKATQRGGAYWTISSTADKAHQDAAWEYISFMTKPDTIKRVWQVMASVGLPTFPASIIHKNLNVADYMDIPKEWSDAVTECLKYSRDEYVYKDRIEPYLGPPVQAVLLDADADAYTELVKAAKKIVEEIPNTVLAVSAK